MPNVNWISGRKKIETIRLYVILIFTGNHMPTIEQYDVIVPVRRATNFQWLRYFPIRSRMEVNVEGIDELVE